jgi:hypothetical protein
MASPPRALISSATRVRPSILREARTTLAPWLARHLAMASPMPRLAPVTMATLPESWRLGVETGVLMRGY